MKYHAKACQLAVTIESVNMPRTLLQSLQRTALFYNYLSITVGCRNYYFDRQQRRYRLDHRPTLIYCSVLNAIYVSLVPLVAIKIVQSFRSCVLTNLLLYINWVTSITNIASFIITLCMIWFRRSQLCRLANISLKLLRILIHEAEVSEGMRRILDRANRFLAIKSLLSLFIYIQAIQWIYVSSNQGCGRKVHTINTGFLISLGLTAVLMLMQVLVEYNVYNGLLHGNMLLSGWLHEMTVIRNEVHTLIAAERHLDRIPCWHGIHWKQLQEHSARIVQHQRETKDFIWRHVAYQQYQMTASLLKIFLESIALAFDIVVELQTTNKGTLYMLVTLLINFCNIVMLFYESEGIQRHFVEMAQVVFEIRQQFSATKQCEARKQMSQMLEIFSLEMRQSNCKLQLCGFFNFNMATASNMIKAIVINLLLLIQYAFKDFERELHEKKLHAEE